MRGSAANITGIVLAGGKSRRMGQNKAFLLYDNLPLLNHSLNLMASLCSEVIISGDPEVYDFVHVTTIPDLQKDLGPIGGICACLASSSHELNMIVPCDMPNITADVYHLLLSQMADCDVVVVNDGKRRFPTCAVYKKSALQSVQHQIEIGDYKLHNLLDTLNTREVLVDDTFDWFHDDLFRNINMLTDLKT